MPRLTWNFALTELRCIHPSDMPYMYVYNWVNLIFLQLQWKIRKSSCLWSHAGCTFSPMILSTFSLGFGIDWFFLKLIDAYSNGNYYFMEILVYHSLASYQEAGGMYILLLSCWIIFFPFTFYVSTGTKSAEKTIKSYTQTSTSSSCLRNPCWQPICHIPQSGVF